jgi:hypothetical protein
MPSVDWSNLPSSVNTGWGRNANRAEFEAAVRNNTCLSWAYSACDRDTGVTAQTNNWRSHVLTYDGSKVPWYVDTSALGSGSGTQTLAT